MYIQTSRTITLGLFLFIAAFGQSPITDANWVNMPGTNGGVNSLAIDKSDNLYAGGLFDTAGGIRAKNIARWDGSTWNTLGSGINGRVYSLSVDDSGKIYAGGDFDTAGGIKATNIARWDGKLWSALGSGANGSVTALAVNDSGHLFAAGQFDTAGGVRTRGIALWDGSSWSALGNSLIYARGAIAIDHPSKLYASNTLFVFKWDGGKWDTLGEAGGNSTIYTLAVDKSSNLYVGASGWPSVSSIGRTGAGGVNFMCVARWNGSAWSAIGTSSWNSLEISPAHVSVIAFNNSGNLFAGGNFKYAEGLAASGIASWDGNSWAALGSGLHNKGGVIPPVEVNAIAIDKLNNLYVSGGFDTAGGKPAAGLAKCVLNGVLANSSLYNSSKPVVSPTIIGNKLFFSLAKPSISQFKVFDCAGRVILQSSPAVLGAGYHVMNISPLSPGVYILDFHAGNKSFKGKFSIAK
jgi:trimeric autotransporter adhesin